MRHYCTEPVKQKSVIFFHHRVLLAVFRLSGFPSLPPVWTLHLQMIRGAAERLRLLRFWVYAQKVIPTASPNIRPSVNISPTHRVECHSDYRKTHGVTAVDRDLWSKSWRFAESLWRKPTFSHTYGSVSQPPGVSVFKGLQVWCYLKAPSRPSIVSEIYRGRPTIGAINGRPPFYLETQTLTRVAERQFRPKTL